MIHAYNSTKVLELDVFLILFVDTPDYAGPTQIGSSFEGNDFTNVHDFKFFRFEFREKAPNDSKQL